MSSNSSLSISSHCYHDHSSQVYRCLSSSTSSIRKRKSDSIILVHQHRPATRRLRNFTSKHRSLSHHSPHNINSITYDSTSLSDTTITTSSSNSDVFTPTNQKADKTWRLKINDELNKDGSRHFVMHKGIFNK
jgi:hypothetical protein